MPSQRTDKKFHFISFGCKVNRYDGQLIVEELERAGWTPAATVEEADLVVVNCCVVTGRSAGRCRRTVRSMARRNGVAPLVVTGCQTPDDAAATAAIDPRVLLAGQGEGLALVRRFLSSSSTERGVCGLKDRTRAFVKVQDGCDLGCTYCVIPSIRGPSRSRPVPEILAEVRRLLAAGYEELVICGIRLGGFRDGGLRLADLLERILVEEKGRYRIRLSSLNPAEVTDRLLDVMRRDRRVARHLHLPLQSGDDGTLRRMRRPYGVARFLETVDKVRAALDRPALSTDFIVGFPGEDGEAFARSLETLGRIKPSRVHVFPYSIRKGTAAAALPQVADREKTDRAEEARRVAAHLKESYDLGFLGDEAEVLVEGTGPGLAGLTSRYQKTKIGSPAGETKFPGASRIVTVRLEEYDRGVFTGRLAAPAGREGRVRQSGKGQDR